MSNVVAVTGASGLIGSRVVAHLRELGCEVRALSRSGGPPDCGAQWVCGDIRDEAAVGELLEGCACAVHLAGIAHTALRTPADRERARSINVGGTERLLLMARSKGVARVLLASSAHVYAGQSGIALSEQAPVAADSVYAAAKLQAERLGMEAAAHAPPEVVIVRPCLTYGPGARFNLRSLMRAIQSGYCFHILGHNPLRSFLSVENAAAAIAHLLERGGNGRVYNLADREPQRLDDFTNALAEMLGARTPRTIPQLPLRMAAAIASPLGLIGLHPPINAESIRKLTTPFSLDVGHLASTGFAWRGDERETVRSMVEAFRSEQRR